MNADFYVYVLFRLNGIPCYVGKGKGDRWVRHEMRRVHYNVHLRRIIEQARAVGQELPKVKIREGLTEAEAFEIERVFIAAIGREQHGGPLVNRTDGGDGESGKIYTDEQRMRMSLAGSRKRLSAEHKANISAAMKVSEKVLANVGKAARATAGIMKTSGWWSTEEGRAKQRANNPGHTGHKHSPETKQKLRFMEMQRNARATVQVSPAWVNRNSVRYPQLAA